MTKMKKCNLLIGFIIFFAQYANAQRLKIGDTVPDFEIKDVIRHTDSVIHLSDFKGKAIILDFWGHGCTGCINGFPKVDALQAKYGQDLQIILVNNESRDSTERWLKKRTGVKLPAVPIVTGGGVLSASFPQNAYPLHVWIDADRVVRHITHGWNATGANIEAFVKKDALDLSVVEYVKTDKEKKAAVQRTYNEMVDSAVSFSYLARYHSNTDVNPGNHLFSRQYNKWRFSVTSADVEWLFRMVYLPGDEWDAFPNNALIFEMKNTFPYKSPDDPALMDRFYANYLYTYDYALETDTEEVFRKRVAEDLMNKFNLNVTMQERSIPQMVLKRTRKAALTTNGGEPVDSLYGISPFKTRVASPRMQNIPFGTLVHRLKARMKATRGMALTDETGFEGNIDIHLSAEALLAKDNGLLTQELARYGLILKEEKRKQACLVFRERR